MKVLKSIFGLVLASILLMGIAAGSADAQTYQFKGRTNNAPYEFINKDGQPDGFNIEILKAISEEQDFNFRVELEPWYQVKHEFERGRIDGVTGMYSSREAEEYAYFGDPLVQVAHVIFVRNDSKIRSLLNIKSRKVLVEKSQMMVNFLNNSQIATDITMEEDPQKAFNALIRGEYDCVLWRKMPGLHYLTTHGMADEIKTTGSTFEKNQYFIAIKKGNNALFQNINAGIQALKENGRYDEIYNKWFDIEPSKSVWAKTQTWIWINIGIIMVLVIWAFWSLNLKKEVTQRTQRMEKEIQARKSAEEELRDSERKYRSLIENSNDAIYLIFNNKIEIVNQKFKSIFGYSENELYADHFDFRQLVSPQSRDLIGQREKDISSGKNVGPNYEFTGLSKAGDEIDLEASVSYVKYKDGYAQQSILRDITERKRMQEKMQQMQKMEAIGTLAGGIAHDFNNILTVINGHAEMVLMQLDESHRARKSMQRIMTSGNRAKDLTSKLLAFSRRQYHQATALNVNETLDSFKNMVQGLLDDHTELDFMLAKDTVPIKADPNQLEQILYNLTMNANDAVEDVKDGKERSITIQSRMASKAEVQSVMEADMPKGDYVVIAVNDTGVGIEPDAMPKIFDPFFSTKEKGRGTGLGLATVYGIIKQNHGNILIDSTPGQGTSVKVFWPVSKEKLEEKKQPVEKPVQGGQETILLVEDDKEVREFNSSVLRNLGYNIIEADNGKSALAVYEESDKKIDLVLTDVIMPIMNGKELAQQLREKDKQIKIIFMSGYTDDQLSDRGDLLQDISFIQKPFSIKRLDGEIRNVLKASSSAN